MLSPARSRMSSKFTWLTTFFLTKGALTAGARILDGLGAVNLQNLPRPDPDLLYPQDAYNPNRRQ